MNMLIALLSLASLAAADVSHLVRSPEADAQIISQDSEVLPDNYRYNYQTSNGIAAQESGVLKNLGQDSAIEVQGSNQYTAPDGSNIQLTYIANEFGYQPKGDHLPTTPAPLPIPDYILKAIDYINAHPPTDESAYRP